MSKRSDKRTAFEKYNDPDTHLLTLNETAEILGVAYLTALNAYKKNGQITNGLPVIVCGARLLKVRVADLKRLLTV
jgi:hypothetical protein